LKVAADDLNSFDYETGEAIPFNLTNFTKVENGDTLDEMYSLNEFKVRESSLFGDFPLIIVNNISQA
jgi:hypothetical protein